MDDGRKTNLLRSLSIERPAVSASLPKRLPVLATASLGIATALVLVAVVLWRVNANGSTKPIETARPTAPAPVTTATVPVSQSQTGGTLIASGYVVARRRATVASEVTGKVRDVVVDEGMVVEAGQVLARLDSVLAEKDLALAKSRADAPEAAVAAIAADLRDAERIFNRTKILAQTNAASQRDLTKNESRVEARPSCSPPPTSSTRQYLPSTPGETWPQSVIGPIGHMRASPIARRPRPHRLAQPRN